MTRGHASWALCLVLASACATAGPDPRLAGRWVLRPEASQLPHGEWAAELDLRVEGRDLAIERSLLRAGVRQSDRFSYRTDGRPHQVPHGHPHEAPFGWTQPREVSASWKGEKLHVRYQRQVERVVIPYLEIWEIAGTDVLEVRTTYEGDRLRYTIHEVYAREGTSPDLGAYVKRASRERDCYGYVNRRYAYRPNCAPVGAPTPPPAQEP